MNNEGLPRKVIEAMRESAKEIQDLKTQLFELQTFMCCLIIASPGEAISIPITAIHHMSTLNITDIVVDKQSEDGHIVLAVEKKDPADSTVIHLP